MSDETKMELIAGLDGLVELCDSISELDAKAMSQDHMDDKPRNLAVKALDGLIQNLFGELTQPQDAQVRLALHRLRENEKQDFENDKTKQKARIAAGDIREKARKLRDLLVSTAFMLLVCVNAHALEGFATYYTEESCKREGTSGVWTASGERFDENALTCAMRSRDWGKKFLVYSPDTGKSIIVRLNDFGPGKKATKNGTIIDLTPAGMKALGIWGKAKVNVQEVL
jgi:rare lipoprotein A (peptidoglycan hydrolase)